MEAERVGREVEQSPWLDHAVRVGLVAYGVVHLLIGWLAVQLALGDREGKASSTGALAELNQQPFGGVLIVLVAIGMFLLVLWRLLEAGFAHRREDGMDKAGKIAVSLFKAVIYGALGASAVKVATGSGSSGSGGTDTMTAKLMDLPAGQILVVLAGLAIIGYGGFNVHRGWTEKFREHLDAQGQSGRHGSAYVRLGKVGYIAKGAAMMIIGGLFGYAGLTHDPKKSGGLDEALQEVVQAPFGPVLLGLIAVGIACYGLFCFARAKHLDR